MAKVSFINNAGGGFAGEKDFQDGETLEGFLARQGITNPQDYTIRLNREQAMATTQLRSGDRVSAVPNVNTVSGQRTLREGDRVTATPKNVAGA